MKCLVGEPMTATCDYAYNGTFGCYIYDVLIVLLESRQINCTRPVDICNIVKLYFIFKLVHNIVL